MELPSSSELFQKHFGRVSSVNLNHPKIENFFSELAEVCEKEDRQSLIEMADQCTDLYEMYKKARDKDERNMIRERHNKTASKYNARRNKKIILLIP